MTSSFPTLGTALNHGQFSRSIVGGTAAACGYAPDRGVFSTKYVVPDRPLLKALEKRIARPRLPPPPPPPVVRSDGRTVTVPQGKLMPVSFEQQHGSTSSTGSETLRGLLHTSDSYFGTMPFDGLQPAIAAISPSASRPGTPATPQAQAGGGRAEHLTGSSALLRRGRAGPRDAETPPPAHLLPSDLERSRGMSRSGSELLPSALRRILPDKLDFCSRARRRYNWYGPDAGKASGPPSPPSPPLRAADAWTMTRSRSDGDVTLRPATSAHDLRPEANPGLSQHSPLNTSPATGVTKSATKSTLSAGGGLSAASSTATLAAAFACSYEPAAHFPAHVLKDYPGRSASRASLSAGFPHFDPPRPSSLARPTNPRAPGVYTVGFDRIAKHF